MYTDSFEAVPCKNNTTGDFYVIHSKSVSHKKGKRDSSRAD